MIAVKDLPAGWKHSLAGGSHTIFAVMEKAMKKISLVGLALGATLGIIAGLLAGGWLFWLGLGLAIGLLIGSAQTRREHVRRGNIQTGNLKFLKAGVGKAGNE